MILSVKQAIETAKMAMDLNADKNRICRNNIASQNMENGVMVCAVLVSLFLLPLLLLLLLLLAAFWQAAFWQVAFWQAAFWEAALWQAAFWQAAFWQAAFWQAARQLPGCTTGLRFCAPDSLHNSVLCALQGTRRTPGGTRHQRMSSTYSSSTHVINAVTQV